MERTLHGVRDLKRDLKTLMQSDQFAGYAYAYPHKLSYRTLEPAVELQTAWQEEDKSSLYLYVHIPFCEMRCGFCNLFTTVRPGKSFVGETLKSIVRQSGIVAQQIQPERISQLAFGGGTPSFLSIEELQYLLSELDLHWPIDWQQENSSFEVSPATVSREKLALLEDYKVSRVSMGVQSFDKGDLKNLGRPQANSEVHNAIELIKQSSIPVFNLDLIYGMQGQTEVSWLNTVQQTLSYRPEEVFLYPLYVRPLTGLGNTGKSTGSDRRSLFLVAREKLLEAGYQQISMRLFRRPEAQLVSDYCCQEDGMVGLGPGARSYTQSLHYSSEYAVKQKGVKNIIAEFNESSDESFQLATYGVRLEEGEQKRRYLIKSLLNAEGLNRADYSARFHGPVETDFPQLAELSDLGMVQQNPEYIRLNADGLSWSDVIGPWLYSDTVVERMNAFELA